MNISIIGPEGSGKTTFANDIAKKVCSGRPIFFVGKKKTAFRPIDIENIHKVRNGVIIIDDANAYLESYDVYNKNLNVKAPFVLHREFNVVHICVFHSFDDAIKYFFRQSRYIYVSDQYRDETYKKNKYIKGISPVIVGKGKWLFNRFKRY